MGYSSIWRRPSTGCLPTPAPSCGSTMSRAIPMRKSPHLYGKTVSFSKSQLMRAHGRLRQLLEERKEETACTPLSTNS